MEKTYIKSEKSVTLDPPPLLAAKRKNTQRILLAIVLLIGLTSAVIGMAIPCAFPDLFLNIPPAVDDALAGVPDVRQSDGEGSAAASLQAVMAYYGLDRGEQEWQDAIGATTGMEETTTALATTARAEGFDAEVKDGAGPDELAALISEGIPVIVPLEGEHYVVVVRVEKGMVIFEDPAVFGERIPMKIDEFSARWTGGTVVVIREHSR